MIDFLWKNFIKKTTPFAESFEAAKACSLFENFNSYEILQILKKTHLRKYSSGEFVFQQGSLGSGLYIVVSGEVEIFLENSPSKQVITKLKKGDFFGETALFNDSERRMASSMASTEVKLLGFFRTGLEELMKEHPKISARLLHQMSALLSERLIYSSQKILEIENSIKQR